MHTISKSDLFVYSGRSIASHTVAEVLPEAVLTQESGKEAQASEDSGEAKVLEVITNGVLDSRKAGLDGLSLLNGILPGEEGRLADTSAVVFKFEKLEPLVDVVVVALSTEAVGKGVERKTAIDFSSSFNALLVGGIGAGEVVGVCSDGWSRGPSLLNGSVDVLAGAVS